LARPVSTPFGTPSPRTRRDAIVATVILAVGASALVTLATAAGCSYDRAADGDITFKETGPAEVGDAQVFEVGDDAAIARDKLCGELSAGTCDPDRGEICTRLDAGGDGGEDGAPDGDAGEVGAPLPDSTSDAIDSAGSGTTRACRVVREANKPTTACAPAGTAALEEKCSRDADCLPGLACVGSALPRCLPYCCSATPELDPCHASGRYCTPLSLAERIEDKVPVCVLPDQCTLLDDSAKDCQAGDGGPGSGTTCTIVTKYGDTSCVPVGTGLDLACCDEAHPCSRNYACLGPSGARACRKLCHEGKDEECTPGTCQKVSSVPAGFGVCSVGDAGTLDGGGCKSGS
jgi:hypothetical protein